MSRSGKLTDFAVTPNHPCAQAVKLMPSHISHFEIGASKYETFSAKVKKIMMKLSPRVKTWQWHCSKSVKKIHIDGSCTNDGRLCLPT